MHGIANESGPRVSNHRAATLDLLAKGQHRSIRRRIMAVLRMSCMRIAFGRTRGVGALGIGAAALSAIFASPASAQKVTVGATTVTATGTQGEICEQAPGSTTWTCQVPKNGGGFAIVSNVPSLASDPTKPDTAQIATWMSTHVGSGAILLGDQTSSASGTSSIAIGNGANASNINATAIGHNSTALGTQANAIGSGVKAAGAGSIAIGGVDAASVNGGAGAVVSSYVGFNTQATGNNAVSIGMGAGYNASGLGGGTNNVAIGYETGINTTTTATGTVNVAIGSEAGQNVTNSNNVALGSFAGNTVSGARNTAIGVNAGGNVSGLQNTAIGRRAGIGVTTNSTTSIGDSATALAMNSTAIGANTRVTSASGGTTGAIAGTAIGSGFLNGQTSVLSGATVSGAGATAIGSAYATTFTTTTDANGKVSYVPTDGVAGANASGVRSLALGSNARANGLNSISAGSDSQAQGDNSISLGTGANTSGGWAIAMGYYTVANGNSGSAIAMGPRAQATGGYNTTAIAIGENSVANHAGIALGYGAKAPQNAAIAMGWGADTTDAASGVAIGDRAVAKGSNAIAIGGNADQTATKADGTGALAIGSGGNATGTGAVAVGGLGGAAGGSIANQNYAVAIGAASSATGIGAVAIGGSDTAKANASGLDSIAVGAGANASATNSFAFGKGAAASAENSIAFGKGAQALSLNSISIGTGGVVTGIGSGAFGDPNTVSGDGSYAFGNNNTIANTSTFVMGNSVTTSQNNSVVLGNASTDRAANPVADATVGGITYGNFAGQAAVANGVVSIGHAGSERQLINVAAGDIAPSSTDAINGSQLHATNTVIGNLATSTATALGGGSTVLADGSIFLPTYNISGTDYHNVGDALGALNTTANAGWYLSANGSPAGVKVGPGGTIDVSPLASSNLTVAQDANGSLKLGMSATPEFASVTTGTTVMNTNGLTIAGGPSVTTSGISAGGNTITGVANGVNGSDAVNLSQLNSAALAGQNADGRAVKYDWNDLNSDGVVDAGEVDYSRATLEGGASGTTLSNVAPGLVDINSTEAINGSQLYATNTVIGNLAATTANALGGGSAVLADGSISLPTYNISGGTYNSVGDALGALNTTANAGWDLGVNGGAGVNIAPGGTVDVSSLNTNLTVAQPSNGKLTLEMSDTPEFTSVTTGNTLMNTNGLTITGGPSVTTSGIYAGGNTITGVANGVNASDAVNLSQLNSAALAGQNADGRAVKYDWNDLNSDGVVDAGEVDYSRATLAGGASGTTLSHVAPGLVDVNSTEAINGSQLYATNTVIGNLATTTATALGGGSAVLADGSISLPTYNISGTNYYNVGDALGALNTTANAGWDLGVNGGAGVNIAPGGKVDVSSLNTNLTVAQPSNGKLTLEMSDTPEFTSVKTGNTLMNTNGLTIAGGPSITTSGISAGGNTITGVANGVNGTDAVNLSQLNSAALAGQNADGRAVKYDWTDLNSDGVVDAGEVDYSRTTLAGGAGGTTLSNVAPGLVDINSTDAINGSQLFGTNQIVQTQGYSAAAALGGTSNYNPLTGTITTALSVGTVTYDNVNSALNAVNTTANAGWDLAVNGGSGINIAPGGTVDVSSSSPNLTVAQDANGSLKLGMSATPSFTSVTTGNTLMNTNGLTIAGGPSVTTSGIHAGGNTITGVANGNVALGSTDAVNGSQLYAATFAGQSANERAVKYDWNDSNGDGIVDPGEVDYSRATLAGGASGTTLSNVAPGLVDINSTEAINGSQLYATNTIIANLATSTAASLGGGSTVLADGSVSAPSYTISGTTYYNVGSALGALNTTANAGWYLSANGSGAGVKVGPGGTIDVSPSSTNLTVAQDANGSLKLGMSDTPLFTSVTTGATTMDSTGVTNGNTALTSSGLAVTGGANGTVALTNSGLNNGGNTITGVANGVNGTDAVNLSQLNSAALAGQNADERAVKYDWTDLNNDGVVSTGEVDYSRATLAGGAGGTTLSNVAAGALNATSTDAVNGSQLHATNVAVEDAKLQAQGNTAALGGGANYDPATNTYTGPTYATSTGNYNNVGDALTAANTQTNTLGSNMATGLGGDSHYDPATGQLTTALTLGGNTYSSVNDALAAVNSSASAGWNVTTAATGSGVVNGTAVANVAPGATHTITAGDNMVATQNGTEIQLAVNPNLNVTSVTTGNTVTNGNGVTISGGSNGTVALSNTGLNNGNNTITNVAAGVNGTDAVNMNQMVALGNSLAAAMSPGSSYNATSGTMTTQIAVGGTIYNTVESAIQAATVANGGGHYMTTAATGSGVASNSSVATVAPGATVGFAAGNNIVINQNGTNVEVAVNPNLTGIQSIAIAGGPTIDANGIDMAGGRITNVGNGIAAGDAINLGQLNSGLADTLASANAYADQVVNAVRFDLSTYRRDANGGTASAMAMGQVPQAFEPGMGIMGFGVSTWQGEQAIAMGFSKASEDGRVIVRASGTYNTRRQAGGAIGFGIQF